MNEAAWRIADNPGRDAAVGTPCPLCGVTMTVPSHRPSAVSRDHILPRERGGRFVIHGDTRNRRLICVGCNGRLGTCGHCVGALACVYAVSGPTSPLAVIQAWGMGVVASSITGPWTRPAAEWDLPPAPKEPRPDAFPHAAARVAIARAVDRIGLPEFIFPAETAAARVWNLARKYDGPVAP